MLNFLSIFLHSLISPRTPSTSGPFWNVLHMIAAQHTETYPHTQTTPASPGWAVHTHTSFALQKILPQVSSKPEHVRRSELIPIARYILFRAHCTRIYASATLIRATASSELLQTFLHRVAVHHEGAVTTHLIPRTHTDSEDTAFIVRAFPRKASFLSGGPFPGTMFNY